jgi:hypothetical protein
MATRILFTIIIIILFPPVMNAQMNTTRLFNPFQLDIDPMERLLLVNIEKDPDSLYIGFEPQVFDDHINGTGHLVIGWRVDGKVDVYHQPGLKLAHEKYNIAGKGLANMLEREMPGSFFQVTENGVQARYEFHDLHNRLVSFKISESHPGKRKPFGLLAPMGDAVENPSAMPLVILQDFYFVRRKHSKIELSIDGRQHTIDNFPIPIDWTKMTFIRYSPKTLIALLNPEYSGALPNMIIKNNQEIIHSDNYEISLEWKKNKVFMKSITRKNAIYPVVLIFNQAFPNIADIENNSVVKGSFYIESHPSTGKIKGIYTVEKLNNEIHVSMIPSKGWKPKYSKLSLRFLYTVVNVFKKWPATYEWTATIQGKGNLYDMNSQWNRTNK